MIKVHLDSHDSGVRAVSLKVQGFEEKVFSPTRVITSTDLNYIPTLRAAKLPIPEYPNQVMEIMKRYNKVTLQKLRKTVKEFAKDKKQLRPRTTHYSDKLSIFRPVFQGDFQISDDDNLALMELGIHSGYNVITIQDKHRTSSVEEFERRMAKSREHIENNPTIDSKQMVAMPTININIDDPELFLAKLKAIHNNGFEMVNVICAGLGYYPNYFHLRKFMEDKDIFVHGSNIRRMFSWKNPTSMTHFLPLFGINSLALQMPSSFKREEQESVHDVKPTNVRRFDRWTGGYLLRGQHQMKHKENLKCSCPYCSNETLSSFYEKHYGQQILAIKTKAHDVYASEWEFERSREYVLSSDYVTYIKNRQYLKQTCRDFLGYGQTKLSAF